MDVKRIFDIPFYQLQHYPTDDCLVDKREGKWIKTSTKQFIDRSNKFSIGLLKLGVRKDDKIAIISNNRSEWNIVDIGILQIGAINVPIYPTASIDDYSFIFNHAEIKLCFVSDCELYEKVMSIKDKVPGLKEIYAFNSIAGCKHWTEVIDAGENGDIKEVEQIKTSIQETDLATLIYTSGTTGTPKGVMLSHRNLVSNAIACIPRLPVDHTAKSLSFLPVCHVYERMILYLYLLRGVSIYFAENMDTIGDNLKEIHPEIFTAVPRLLEKVYDKIVTKGTELKGIKKNLFFWALNLGHKYELSGKSTFYNLQLALARKIIFSKWQEALGGKVQAIASGSAALQPRLARVFNAAGIPVYEGYGLTETSPVVAVNAKSTGMMFGTVGKPLENVEVRIAEDGEILVKGPNVMQGYFKRQDLTDEVMDGEWLHTGDIGKFMEDNFLKITDRKKEIFKTSGGKYIAPQPIENKLKESKFIEQILVIGEGEKHPAALIVPAFDFLKEWCARKNINISCIEEMINNQSVIERIKREVDSCNENLGHWEQIKKFELLPEEWTIENGELTPTLKLKRKVIIQKYQSYVHKIYKQ